MTSNRSSHQKIIVTSNNVSRILPTRYSLLVTPYSLFRGLLLIEGGETI